MKCQFCHKNEADRIFYVDHMNTEYQFSVCESCLQKMWQQSLASGYTEAFQNYSGWWPGQPEPRKFGEKVFPEKADTELKKKRQLSIHENQLKRSGRLRKDMRKRRSFGIILPGWRRRCAPMKVNLELYSPQMLNVFQKALRCAKEKGHRFLGSEHLLWGLAKETGLSQRFGEI